MPSPITYRPGISADGLSPNARAMLDALSARTGLPGLTLPRRTATLSATPMGKMLGREASEGELYLGHFLVGAKPSTCGKGGGNYAPCGPRRPRPTCEPQSTPPGSRARTPSMSSSPRWPENRPARPSAENHASKWGWVITPSFKIDIGKQHSANPILAPHDTNPAIFRPRKRTTIAKIQPGGFSESC